MSNNNWYPNNQTSHNTFPCDTGYNNLPQQPQLYPNQLTHNPNYGSYYDPNTNNATDNINAIAPCQNYEHNYENMFVQNSLNSHFTGPNVNFENYHSNTFPENDYFRGDPTQAGSNEVAGHIPFNTLNTEQNSVHLEGIENNVNNAVTKFSENDSSFTQKLDTEKMHDQDVNMNLGDQYSNSLNFTGYINTSALSSQNYNKSNILSNHKDQSLEEEVSRLLNSIPDKPIVSHRQQLRIATPCASLLPDNEISIPPNMLTIAPPMPISMIGLDSTNSAQIRSIIDDIKDLHVADHGTGPLLIRDIDAAEMDKISLSATSRMSKNVIDTNREDLKPNSSSNDMQSIENSGLSANLAKTVAPIMDKKALQVEANKGELLPTKTMSSSLHDYQPVGTNAALASQSNTMNIEVGSQFNMASGQEQMRQDLADNSGAFKPIGRRSSNRIVPNQEPLVSPEVPCKLISESIVATKNILSSPVSSENTTGLQLLTDRSKINNLLEISPANLQTDGHCSSSEHELDSKNTFMKTMHINSSNVQNNQFIKNQYEANLENDKLKSLDMINGPEKSSQFPLQIQNIQVPNIAQINDTLQSSVPRSNDLNIQSNTQNIENNRALHNSSNPQYMQQTKINSNAPYISEDNKAHNIILDPTMQTNLSSNYIKTDDLGESVVQTSSTHIPSTDKDVIKEEPSFKKPAEDSKRVKSDRSGKYDDGYKKERPRSRQEDIESSKYSRSRRNDDDRRENRRSERDDDSTQIKSKEDKYQQSRREDRYKSKNDDRKSYRSEEEDRGRRKDDDYEKRNRDRKKKEDDHRQDSDRYKEYSRNRDRSSDRHITDPDSKHKYESSRDHRDDYRDSDRSRDKYYDRHRDSSHDRSGDRRHERGREDGAGYDRRRDRSYERSDRYDDPRKSRSNHIAGERPRSRQDDLYRRDDWQAVGGYPNDAYNAGQMYYDDFQDYYYTQGRYQENYLQHPYYDRVYKDSKMYARGFHDEMLGYDQQIVDPRYEYPPAHPTASSSSSDVVTSADRFLQHSGSHSGRSSVVSVNYQPDQSSIQQLRQYEAEMAQRQRRLTPAFFGCPHTKATFTGPVSQMTFIRPDFGGGDRPAHVQIYNVGPMFLQLGNTDEFVRFPGPLIRGETHKNEVLSFCQLMLSEYETNIQYTANNKTPSIGDAQLLWQYLKLLIKQNGSVTGIDIAELILESADMQVGERSIQSAIPQSVTEQEESTRPSSRLSGSSEGYRISAERMGILDPSARLLRVTDRFRQLLLHGRKKEALDWAMREELWGHALFLSSKMDPKTHANVMLRFTSSAMKQDDPLLTLYNLMSGRLPPAVATLSESSWGSWKKHLSIILSNPTQKPDLDRKSIITLGDSLASRGLLHASHFCYLIANEPFGDFRKKSSKIVLVGSNHSGSNVDAFASNVSIQCTWVYEYAMQLGNPEFYIHNLIAYKIMLVVRMLDQGFQDECLKYVECLSNDIRRRPCPLSVARVLTALGQSLIDRDPQKMLLEETGQEPQWFNDLKATLRYMEEGQHVYRSGHVTPFGGEMMGENYAANAALNVYNNQEQLNQWPNAQTNWNSQPQFVNQNQDLSLANSNNYSANGAPPPNDPNTYHHQQQMYEDQIYRQTLKDQVDGGQGQDVNNVQATTGAGLYDYSEVDNTKQPAPSLYTFAPPLHNEQPNYLQPQQQGSEVDNDEVSQLMVRTNFGQPRSRRDSRMSDASSTSPPGSPKIEPPRRQRYPGDDSEDEENRKKIEANRAKNSTLNKPDGATGGGWLSKFNFFSAKTGPKPKEMILPDDSKPTVIYDPIKKKWVDTSKPDADNENENDVAPPKMFEPSQATEEQNSNRFAREKIRGARGQYVDVFGSKGAKLPSIPLDLNSLLPKSASVPANIFVPSSNVVETVKENNVIANNMEAKINHPIQEPQPISNPLEAPPIMFNPANFQSQNPFFPNVPNQTRMRYRRPY